MTRSSLISICVLCCLATRAYAADPAIDAREVLRSNGYDGIWSMDCNRTPTNNVPRINWVVPDQGPPQQWVDIGKGYYLEGIVSGASVTPDGRFTVSVKSLSGLSWVRTTIPMAEKKIRIWEGTRTWQNRIFSDFKDGRGLSDGLVTPPINKCEDPDALTS